MLHMRLTLRATSVLSVPRPLERPEAAWSNISRTGGKRPIVIGGQGAVGVVPPVVHHCPQCLQRRALVNGLEGPAQEGLGVALAQPLDPGMAGRRRGAVDPRRGVGP